VKVCVNPNVVLPTYYAVDMSRLPPFSANHCDMSAVLLEMQSLRSEVREVDCLRNEIDSLKQQIVTLEATVKGLSTGQVNNQSMATCDDAYEIEFPQLPAAKPKYGKGTQDGQLFAHFAVDLQKTVMTSQSTVNLENKLKQIARSSSVRKTVIGTSASNKHVASVKTFVYRCHPHTAQAMLTDCVEVIKGDMHVQDVSCTKPKSRYEHLYSSFHVQVQVASSDFKKAIDLFMSAEAWPSDLLVRRYFPPKDGDK